MSFWMSRRAWVGACVVAWSCGESHPGDDASTGGRLGEPCRADEECVEGICLAAGRCSRLCDRGDDCPDAPWLCVSLPGRGSLCECTPLADAEVACNELDDDCDARVDETSIVCGSTCVDGSSDPANCGACGLACGGGTACREGVCACPDERPDVCGSACVDTATDPANCGACGTVCAAEPPAAPACVASICALECPAGTGDCDGEVADGCETDTATNAAHCGACDAPCNFASATGHCAGGACVIDACDAGFEDCNAEAADGCEANVETSTMHCGGCGVPCDLPGAVGRCEARTCVIGACDAGFADCDSAEANGCEVDTRSDPAHCGACTRVCPGSGHPHTTATCTATVCGTSCTTGFGDCDAVVANGCETDTDESTSHCGTCGRPCAAGEVCRMGACTTRRFTGVTGAAWEMIAAGGGVNYPGYSDYSPAGSDFVYATTGNRDTRFARFDGALLSWTTPVAGSDTSTDGYFAGPAWVGGDLYLIVAGSVHRYDIAGVAWATPLTGIATSRWSQAAHDDSGHVYALTSDGRVATYTIATNSIAYRPLGSITVAVGPRAAWDSESGLLYVAPDLTNASLFSFDPATGAVATLAPLPASHVTPTFCSDRSGHLYAAGDNRGMDIWQYDIATDTWATIPPLPFDHDANGACTVSDSGFLYVTDTGAAMARIRLL